MYKIEKLTATKIQHGHKLQLNVAIKLDNGLLVQGDIPVYSSNPEGDITKALGLINDIIAQIFDGINPLHQKELDKMLTELTTVHNQDVLAINISLGISLILLKAAAALHNKPVRTYLQTIYSLKQPSSRRIVPVFKCIADKREQGQFKEFSIIPSRAFSIAKDFEIFRKVKAALDAEINTPSEVMNTVQLEILQNKISELGYTPHRDIFIGIKPELCQVADSEFICNDMVGNATQDQIIEYFREIQTLYAPLITENPFIYHTFSPYAALHKEIGEQSILTLNTDIINSAHKCKYFASLMPGSMLALYPPSIKTVSHCIELIKLAEGNDLKIMVDTSGIKGSTTLSAIAEAFACDFIKIDSCTEQAEKEFSYVE